MNESALQDSQYQQRGFLNMTAGQHQSYKPALKQSTRFSGLNTMQARGRASDNNLAQSMNSQPGVKVSFMEYAA